jgi:LmbE family N-acetylglucosaminyl deacetylase
VRAFAPDFVYAPWIGDYHVDHYVLARVARLALALIDFGGEAWGYEVWTPLVPTRIVDISDVYERKVRALHEHASQMEYRDMGHTALAITAQRAMYLSDEARHGEAFRPLGEVGSEDRKLL